MTDNRKSGVALMAGSLGGMLTMAIHPATAGSLNHDQLDHLALVSGAAHSIAMVSVLLLILGACGLTRCIAAPDRISFAALVTFGFACVAALIATSVSGFIIPGMMSRMAGDVPSSEAQWHIVIEGVFQINQAFAKIYSVAASAAIALWSVSALRNGGFGRGVAVLGCVNSAVIILGIGIGHLRLNIHGMAMVELGQSAWLILVGSRLYSRPEAHASPN